MIPPSPEAPILLFDGVCSLCNGAVNFVIDRDPAGKVRFGALQSEAGQQLLSQAHLPPAYLDSLVLFEGEHVYTGARGAIRLAWHLGGAWKAFWLLRVLPSWMLEPLYGFVARHRYRWFGQLEACRMPTPELRSRFI